MAQSQPSLFEQFASGWRGYALIALIALMSGLFGAGRVPVMDADEARFAQASRQMVESGEYVLIRLQDEERRLKPIGVYWAQAASVQLFEPLTGRTNAIWPYRLPSALGIVLAALAVLWGGTALIGSRAALYGAGLFAAGVLVGFEGMTAKTDALLLGFTSLAMAALARLRPPAGWPGPRALALVFWAALALGVMIKGPVTPLVVALTLLAIAGWERRFAWLKPLAWWPGPLLAVAIVAPWAVLVSIETNGRFFADMFAEDIVPKLLSGQESHFALPGFHTFLLPFLIFPATYALPAAARIVLDAVRAPGNDDGQAPIRFLIAWAVPILIFFELAPTKLPHYALPAYPAIALLCGAGLSAIMGRRWRTAHPAGVVMFAVCGISIVALMAASATFMPGDFAADFRRAVSTALIGIGVVGAGTVALIMLRRPAARAAAMVLCALALSFSLRERLLPEARSLFVSSEAVAALTRSRLTPRDTRPLWVVGYNETSLVFLTRTSIRVAEPMQAAEMAAAGDAMIVEGRLLQTMASDLAVRGLAFAPAEPPVRGFALGRGERVALFVGQVTEAPVLNEAADGR